MRHGLTSTKHEQARFPKWEFSLSSIPSSHPFSSSPDSLSLNRTIIATSDPAPMHCVDMNSFLKFFTEYPIRCSFRTLPKVEYSCHFFRYSHQWLLPLPLSLPLMTAFRRLRRGSHGGKLQVSISISCYHLLVVIALSGQCHIHG